MTGRDDIVKSLATGTFSIVNSIRRSTTAFRSFVSCKDAQLFFRGSAPLENRVNMLDLLARPEFVHHVVNKVQQLENQIARRHFFLLAKVDHLAVDSPTHGAPFVFLNQHAPVKAKAKILARSVW